jgi:hypothetical protein
MRYAKVLGVGALGLALACSDTGGPSAQRFDPETPSFAGGVAGAAYTTTNPTEDGTGHCLNGPGLVNCNIYDGKQYVWINGGPTNGTSALSDGTYFFTVLVPGGQNPATNDGLPDNLSDGANGAYTTREFTVVGNQIFSFIGSGHDTYTDATQGLMIRLVPYDNTTNPGGVYILAICRLGDTGGTLTYPVDPSLCKYDAFKIRAGNTNEEGNPELSGLKYYDANANGRYDTGDEGIPGWKIDVTNYGVVTTGAGGTFDIAVSIGEHVFTEQQPGNGWTQTGNTLDQTFSSGNSASLLNFVYTVDAVGDGFTTGLNFGNVCNRVTPGGHTMGFWSNKNGQDLITSADITALNAFYLAKGTGNQTNFANKGEYKTWLLSANATNMAYMLSAQMSATYLSTQHGFTNGSAIVDYFDSAYDTGFPAPRTVTQEIAYADYLLSLNQVTVAASALRTEQTRVKNILDSINNGGTFQAPTLAAALSACGTPFPVINN